MPPAEQVGRDRWRGDGVYHVSGALTMRGVTKPIALHAVSAGTEIDPWGNERVGIEATGELNRSDFDTNFNQALGSGNMMVSDKVRMNPRHLGGQAVLESPL